MYLTEMRKGQGLPSNESRPGEPTLSFEIPARPRETGGSVSSTRSLSLLASNMHYIFRLPSVYCIIVHTFVPCDGVLPNMIIHSIIPSHGHLPTIIWTSGNRLEPFVEPSTFVLLTEGDRTIPTGRGETNTISCPYILALLNSTINSMVYHIPTKLVHPVPVSRRRSLEDRFPPLFQRTGVRHTRPLDIPYVLDPPAFRQPRVEQINVAKPNDGGYAIVLGGYDRREPDQRSRGRCGW